MAIANIPSPGAGSLPLFSVDDFRREAAIGETVRLQVDGESFALVASGRTPSGRSVAWVDGGGDTTMMFVDALTGRYGNRLSQAVADELGLQPAPGKPLSSRTVREALEMAETASVALEGLRFAQQLASAPADVPGVAPGTPPDRGAA